jgi:hypothetical protein
MAAIAFTLFRLPPLATVGLAAVGLSIFLLTLVQVPASSIAQVQVAQQRGAKAQPNSSMSRCMATWDRSAQMSKQEWKETCKRVIRENPGLYNKIF